MGMKPRGRAERREQAIAPKKKGKNDESSQRLGDLSSWVRRTSKKIVFPPVVLLHPVATLIQTTDCLQHAAAD